MLKQRRFKPKNTQTQQSSSFFAGASVALAAIAIILLFAGLAYARKQAASTALAAVQPAIVRETEPASSPLAESLPPASPPAAASAAAGGQEPQAAQNRVEARLFFVRSADDGRFALRGSSAQVLYSDSLLKPVIEALLAGPQLSERSRGAYSLIPENSALLSAKVSGQTAFLDFNESFRFNSLGFEGFEAQLQQIVYTATELEGVSQVQILIEGHVVDYLSEGVYVGKPLTRASF